MLCKERWRGGWTRMFRTIHTRPWIRLMSCCSFPSPTRHRTETKRLTFIIIIMNARPESVVLWFLCSLCHPSIHPCLVCLDLLELEPPIGCHLVAFSPLEIRRGHQTNYCRSAPSDLLLTDLDWVRPSVLVVVGGCEHFHFNFPLITNNHFTQRWIWSLDGRNQRECRSCSHLSIHWIPLGDIKIMETLTRRYIVDIEQGE